MKRTSNKFYRPGHQAAAAVLPNRVTSLADACPDVRTGLAILLSLAASLVCAPSDSVAQPAVSAISDNTLRSGREPVRLVANDNKTGSSKSRRNAQSIKVLVNDEPVTAYEISRRAGLLAMNGGASLGKRIQERAKSRWQQIVKDPKLNERFKAELQRRNVQSREEAQKVQKQFIKKLQQDMVARIRSEEQAKMRRGMEDEAVKELIEEKLKLQEARRLNMLADDSEVDRILTGIAGRNKMDLEQFAAYLKRGGTDIRSMRSRLKATLSWQQVVRRRFGFQVAMLSRDVDRFMDQTADTDDVELRVHRITVPLTDRENQQAMAERLAQAEKARATFRGCETSQAIAASIPGAKFEDLGTIKSSAVKEPTRSMLMSANDGDMLPPSLLGKTGVELWAVCGRNTVSEEAKRRAKEQGDVRQEEFGILAQKHLKDLKQDATIVYR